MFSSAQLDDSKNTGSPPVNFFGKKNSPGNLEFYIPLNDLVKLKAKMDACKVKLIEIEKLTDQTQKDRLLQPEKDTLRLLTSNFNSQIAELTTHLTSFMEKEIKEAKEHPMTYLLSSQFQENINNALDANATEINGEISVNENMTIKLQDNGVGFKKLPDTMDKRDIEAILSGSDVSYAKVLQGKTKILSDKANEFGESVTGQHGGRGLGLSGMHLFLSCFVDAASLDSSGKLLVKNSKSSLVERGEACITLMVPVKCKLNLVEVGQIKSERVKTLIKNFRIQYPQFLTTDTTPKKTSTYKPGALAQKGKGRLFVSGLVVPTPTPSANAPNAFTFSLATQRCKDKPVFQSEPAPTPTLIVAKPVLLGSESSSSVTKPVPVDSESSSSDSEHEVKSSSAPAPASAVVSPLKRRSPLSAGSFLALPSSEEVRSCEADAINTVNTSTPSMRRNIT